jgi:hypothetical protein
MRSIFLCALVGACAGALADLPAQLGRGAWQQVAPAEDPCRAELEELATEQWSVSNPLRAESNRAVAAHDLCRVLAVEDEIARVADDYARKRRDVLRRYGR